MKTIKFKLLLLTVLAGLSSCKNQEIANPSSIPLDMNTVQIIMDMPDNTSAYDTSDLFAYVTIKNDKNEEVLSNQRLTISFNGKYVTEKIKLNPGNFKISSFIINNGSGYTRFAAPFINSVKAQTVVNPLDISFKLENADNLDIPVGVSKLVAGDKEASFGYGPDKFKLPVIVVSDFIKVKLQSIFTIGDINYDNIPTPFKISRWDSQGNLTEIDTLLAGGVNEVLLTKSAVKYQFKLKED